MVETLGKHSDTVFVLAYTRLVTKSEKFSTKLSERKTENATGITLKNGYNSAKKDILKSGMEKPSKKRKKTKS